MSDDTNREQSRLWNEQAGPKWVAMQRQLDAELESLGAAVIDALDLRAGERVLDVGCGAGATALALAARVAPGEVVGVDISEPLLALARERAAGVADLRFERADAQTATFAGPPFDVVFSRFGVMFFADPVAAFVNLRAALRPGGRLGFVCWRAMEDNGWFTVPLAAALPHLPGPPEMPPPGAPGPFAFADGERTRELLERAGFVDVEVTPLDRELPMGADGLDESVELVLQIGPVARALATAADDLRRTVRGAVREALARHEGPRGVTLPAAAWLVRARRGMS
jgi:SAM-dependent methyltransferase